MRFKIILVENKEGVNVKSDNFRLKFWFTPFFIKISMFICESQPLGQSQFGDGNLVNVRRPNMCLSSTKPKAL